MPNIQIIDTAIGIDPGLNTGMCIWKKSMLVPKKISDRSSGSIELKTEDFWSCFNYVKDYFTPESTAILVEDSAQNKKTFNVIYDKKLGRKRQLFDLNTRSGQNMYAKKSRDVGGVNKEAELLIKGLTLLGFTIIPVRPSTKKQSHDEFMSQIKFKNYELINKSTSNQHERDAARLIFPFLEMQRLQERMV